MLNFLTSPKFPCPVCGYKLGKPAADFTICPSCGVEFGYSDVGISHLELRREWIDFGAKWTSRAIHQPAGWNPWDQLINAGFMEDIPYLRGKMVINLEPTPSINSNSLAGWGPIYKQWNY